MNKQIDMENFIVCTLFVATILIWGTSKPPSSLEKTTPQQKEEVYINYFPEVESEDELEQPTVASEPVNLTVQQLRVKAASLGIKHYYKLPKARLTDEIKRLAPDYLLA